METQFHDSLRRIRELLPRLADVLKLDVAKELGPWAKAVDTRLLARFDPGFPLVAAVCGGGSAGKSTLFNALVGASLSPTGGRAGMNRRVLFALPAALSGREDLVAGLLDPFGAPAAPLERPEDLLVPGGPMFVPAAGSVVLLDTPDFDTGAAGRYANRDSARSALEAADILIYVFTNSNYNNRDNTDFIAEMLTGIGRRKCFLVYRAYPGFSEAEVVEHAMTVGRHIYGAEAGRYVLGIYRADEDNRVAAGEAALALRPSRPGGPAFDAALQAIDLPRLRLELHASIVADALGKARELAGRSAASLEELRRYAAALRAAQGLCLQEALSFFPMDRVVRRFAKIWSETDPPAVKLMRRTGSVIELPVRALAGAAGWAREKLSGAPAPAAPEDQFARRLEENLTAAATALNHYLLSPHLSLRAPSSLPMEIGPAAAAAQTDGTPAVPLSVAAHPALLSARERLRQQDFGSALNRILSRKDEIGRIGSDMDEELRQLADHFRSRMGTWAKISQTFWAALNVLPATVAVTYVLSTGDPVGGATIKVKLAGLFGVKDLYALVAIPMTRGMKKADRKQLKAMLGPLAQSWLRGKSAAVQALFEEALSGEILRAADDAAAAAGRLAESLAEALARADAGRRR
ncbi:MAG: 50S ribosome-binding GTPase [Desulfobacterales bacterium]|nr:50S ribosome-binding GTPase [Desulfobacterales bacterium]